MAVVVTGGAGFVGSHLVGVLARRRPEQLVVVLDALLYPASRGTADELAAAHPNVRVVEGAVGDGGVLEALLWPGDELVHLAVEMGRPERFVETQIGGTKAALDAARRREARRFVYISTSDIYGNNDSDDLTESHPVRPTHLYSATKLGAEALVTAYHHTYGLPVTVLRPVSIYGPRQYPAWLVSRFVTAALAGEPLPVQGTGEARRDWIYVEDVCAAVAAALDADGRADGEVFNLGTGCEWSVLQIARMVLELAGREPDALAFQPPRPGDFGRQVTRAAKARERLGWAARVPFAEGLRRTVEWYRAHPEWVRLQVSRDTDRLGFRITEP
jgi:dTDP-glucose 4,6-dehydratase